LKEGEILTRFIKSGVLSGVWFLEVPIGLETVAKIALRDVDGLREFGLNKLINLYTPIAKHIDAVCVTGLRNMIMPPIKLSEWVQMQRDPSLNPFIGRHVWIVEAKNELSSEKAFTAIGQLLYYEHHFKKDWKGIVDGKAIVYGCDAVDEVTLDVIKSLKTQAGIVSWRVSKDGKVASPT